MCELYVLSHFRDAIAEKVAEKEAAAKASTENILVIETLAEKILAAEKAMRASLKGMAESEAKLSLDFAYVTVACVPDAAARERLVRYLGELYRRAMDDSARCQGEGDV